MNKVIVVGGGAAGLVAGIVAARNGFDVTILEKNNKCGKKILLTGNGKCNYWNDDIQVSHYRSENIDILNNILTDQVKENIKKFFTSIGIEPKKKNNCYYPYSNMAISIQNSLLLELECLGVKIEYEVEVTGLIHKENIYIIETNKGSYQADAVIIGTGSKACPKTGSTGDGYDILKKLGHSIVKPLPALVQLTSNEKFLKDWAGIRIDVDVSLYEDNNLVKKETGEAQLTDYGISGICIMNLSGMIARGLNLNKKEILKINFIPFLDKDNFITWMEKKNNTVCNRTIIQLLESVINYKLLYVIFKKANIDVNAYWNKISNNEKKELAKYITAFELDIIGTKDFDNAQVCSGGLKLDEINYKTFESKIHKNLYIIGEILDVDGDCGGFNLGFAWISGYIAASSLREN